MAAVLWVLTNVLSSGLESEPGAIARRFYATGLGFLIVGIALALQMLRGWPAPGGFPGLLEAHIHANVWGFLGLVSGGACLSLTRRSTGARLPHQALANRCFWFLTAGSGALVVGAWLGLLPLTMLGMLLYVIGTVMMLLTLIAFDRHLHWSSPVLGHVTAAYVWILVPAVVAPVVVMTTGQLPAGGVETAALGAILTGWVLQLGLAAFSGVPLAGRAQGEVGSWLGVALFNLGVLILWISARASNATAPIAVGYALILAVWIARLRAGILTMRHRGAPWL
jgi:cytochrome c oxidase cbb3-type subunit 1